MKKSHHTKKRKRGAGDRMCGRYNYDSRDKLPQDHSSVGIDVYVNPRIVVKVFNSGRRHSYNNELKICASMDKIPELQGISGLLDHHNGFMAGMFGESCLVFRNKGQNVLDQIFMSSGAGMGELHTHRIMISICEQLNIMHKNGFAHFDIKPANICVLPGDWENASLIDFGSSVQGLTRGELYSHGHGSEQAGGDKYYTLKEHLISGENYRWENRDIYCLGNTAYAMLMVASYQDEHGTVRPITSKWQKKISPSEPEHSHLCTLVNDLINVEKTHISLENALTRLRDISPRSSALPPPNSPAVVRRRDTSPAPPAPNYPHGATTAREPYFLRIDARAIDIEDEVIIDFDNDFTWTMWKRRGPARDRRTTDAEHRLWDYIQHQYTTSGQFKKSGITGWMYAHPSIDSEVSIETDGGLVTKSIGSWNSKFPDRLDPVLVEDALKNSSKAQKHLGMSWKALGYTLAVPAAAAAESRPQGTHARRRHAGGRAEAE